MFILLKKIIFSADEPRAWQPALALLGLRLFVAYEFFEAGLEKWHGKNWFAEIQQKFPIPFSWLPAEVNWQVAMWAELLLPVLLLLGLATRFASLGLMILTVVAWAAVHAGLGYNIGDGGYKMAVIYLVTLLPLLLQGGGALSLDGCLKKYMR